MTLPYPGKGAVLRFGMKGFIAPLTGRHAGRVLKERVREWGALRPDLRVEELRGNVDTRLRKLDSQARTYRRDTGVNALMLGYPILTLKETKSDGTSAAKIAPVPEPD